jgi:hypothetical protein
MLLDAKPPKVRTGIWKHLPLLPWLLVSFAIVCILLFYAFRNYPEEKVVENFMTAVEQGDYQKAYSIWQASPSYKFDDFLHDWGPQGDYGKIRQFEIVSTEAKGPQSVIVTLRINNQDPPLNLVVDRKTKGIAYSPF